MSAMETNSPVKKKKKKEHEKVEEKFSQVPKYKGQISHEILEWK